MRKINRALNLLISMGSLALGVMSCGPKTDTVQSPAPQNQNCRAGQGYTTQYGCLSQGSCAPGFGQYGNQCVQLSQSTGINHNCGTGMTYSPYGCQPQGNCPLGYIVYNQQCVMATTPGAQSCQPGYILIHNGCLPQWNCPPGMGFQNGFCIR